MREIDRQLINNCKNGKGLGVNIFIDKGADVTATDEFGNTALHYAVVNGDDRAIEPLITAGANVNAANNKGETPLNLAAQHGQFRNAIILINHGAESFDSHPSYGEVIMSLIEHNRELHKIILLIFNPNHPDFERETMESSKNLVFSAARLGNRDQLETYVLEHGSLNFNIFDGVGFTPLHYAVIFRHHTLVRWMLNNGANPSLAADGVQNALEYASLLSDVEMTRILIGPFDSTTPMDIDDESAGAAAGAGVAGFGEAVGGQAWHGEGADGGYGAGAEEVPEEDSEEEEAAYDPPPVRSQINDDTGEESLLGEAAAADSDGGPEEDPSAYSPSPAAASPSMIPGTRAPASSPATVGSHDEPAEAEAEAEDPSAYSPSPAAASPVPIPATTPLTGLIHRCTGSALGSPTILDGFDG